MSTELDKARAAPGITPDRLSEIRALIINATPGPWRWFGNTNVHDLYLATVHHGRRFVMRFERWGMRDAAPLFQVAAPNGSGVMVRADEMVRYEAPYRKDVDGIDHPDARLIEAAPTAIADLLAEVDRLTAALAEAEAVRARVAELERLQASIHKAADAARKAERADVVAFLGKQAGSFHATNEIDACATLAGAKMAIQHGAHEGAAGGS